MGMSSWIMDLEEQFEDKVVDIIKESEDISEAYAGAIELNKKHHPNALPNRNEAREKNLAKSVGARTKSVETFLFIKITLRCDLSGTGIASHQCEKDDLKHDERSY